MQVISPENYEPIFELVERCHIATVAPFSGKAKRDEMAHAARQQAFREATAAALATFGNAQRARKYPNGRFIEAMDENLLQTWLVKCSDRLVDERAEASNLEEKQATTVQLAKEFLAEFQSFVFTADLENAERDRRRKAIMSGEEQPTEEDREWIAEEIEKQRQSMAELQKIIGTPASPTTPA